jgi:Asp-tRNA(Asn)/Glu-tRNA(Gln) amidotransferase A subunit family amidase
MQPGELVQLGAADLARLIRNGQAEPLEVVDAHIRVIERLNPKINALVTVTFNQARDEARRFRERLTVRRADLPPLFGLPVTIKDSLPVAGVRFTAGSTFHRDNVATRDAEAVRRLKAAGAIVLGKTNCSDMSAIAETSNLIFGLTQNPWSLDHSAGGSSGGEAAIVACGGSPLGLGADLGGSIRIPAAFCGVVGLKPTGGRIPTEWSYPASRRGDQPLGHRRSNRAACRGRGLGILRLIRYAGHGLPFHWSDGAAACHSTIHVLAAGQP